MKDELYFIKTHYRVVDKSKLVTTRPMHSFQRALKDTLKYPYDWHIILKYQGKNAQIKYYGIWHNKAKLIVYYIYDVLYLKPTHFSKDGDRYYYANKIKLLGGKVNSQAKTIHKLKQTLKKYKNPFRKVITVKGVDSGTCANTITVQQTNFITQVERIDPNWSVYFDYSNYRDSNIMDRIYMTDGYENEIALSANNKLETSNSNPIYTSKELFMKLVGLLVAYLKFMSIPFSSDPKEDD